MIELSAESRELCDTAGKCHGVSAAIHSADWIFWFLHDHPTLGSKADAINNYFSDGADSAGKLRALIAEQRPLAGTRVLEFAAGYGRVTRHFRNALPEAEITACDIHRDAVVFLRERINSAALGSADQPEHFNLGRPFDVVFALSFFSHLPLLTWRRWLLALAAHTGPDGLLIFTTHGERSCANFGNPAIGADGFWFTTQSEQRDLPGEQYGSAISLPASVLEQIRVVPHMRLVRFQEAFWWGHQDVYVLRRHAPIEIS